MEQQEALLDDGSPSPRPPTPILTSGDGGGGEGDSSSSSSGLPADAVSAQLINNITMLDYHSLGKTTTLIGDSVELGNTDSKRASPTGAQLPRFVSWNWVLIRKILFWGVLSVLFACVSAVIAMVLALPRTCNPILEWHQGELFYEIFPASFKDSNGDGIGDLKGLASKIDYIQNLGVKVVHLNSIFESRHYPENYKNITSLLKIDKTLGTMSDFANLVDNLHARNISIVLDIPLYPYISQFDAAHQESEEKINENKTEGDYSKKLDQKSVEKSITYAIRYWNKNDVDGFYLKGIENLVDDPHFISSIKLWKKIIGPNKILMVNYDTIVNAIPSVRNSLMYNIDLVDVLLDVTNGSKHIKIQVDDIMDSILWEKPGFPWVHWSIGSVNTRRLSAKIADNNTLAATLLSMMLPGTPSIFYGDEISLQEISEPEDDFHESKWVHNLTPMLFINSTEQFTHNKVLPWITGEASQDVDMQIYHIDAIKKFARIRTLSPAIYINSILKDGLVLPNTHLRYSDKIIVVERWYPRKESFVYVSNLGNERIVADLSSWFYGGYVIVSSNLELERTEVIFKAITIKPSEVIIIKLEK